MTVARSVPLLLSVALTLVGPKAPVARLRIEQVLADSTSFDVNAVLIVGRTESLLWDTQYHRADAERLADRIAATHTRLKAILISHPDHDHYAGTAIILKRFPGTPVYATAAALTEFRKTAARDFGNERTRRPAVMADSLVTPVPLPSLSFTVDGETVQVIPDLQGDALAPTNSVLWIPSQRTVLAGDIVFNGVHPWLGTSTAATRAAWRQSIDRLAALRPEVVVAGHKREAGLPDSPASLQAIARYLDHFEAARQGSPDPAGLVSAMLQKYPDWAVAGLLQFGARVAYQPAPAAPESGQVGGSHAAPADWSPAGDFQVVIRIESRQTGGRLLIAASPAGFRGTIVPDGADQPVPLDSVVVHDGTLLVAFPFPQGPASLQLRIITADSLAGTFTGPIGVAEASAKRVR